MKKLVVFMMAMFFMFSVFGEEYQFSKETEETIAFMNEYGVKYEIDFDQTFKSIPEGGEEISIDGVTEFLLNARNTEIDNQIRSVLLEHYAYANFNNPNGRRLELAGGVNASGYNGYRYKWERRYTVPFVYWGSITRERHCPGQSGSTIVDYCDQTNSSISVMYGDYSEYTACSACDNNVAVTLRYCVNLYTIQWSQIWIPGQGWVWILIRVYADWQCGNAAASPPPYNPVNNICTSLLYNLCPYI